MADPDKNRLAFGTASGSWDPRGGSLAYDEDGYFKQDANGNYVQGTNSYDSDVNYQRERGTRFQPTPQLDLAQANQSRGLQLNALELLRRQATGTAPSSAEILANRANQDAGRAAAQRVTGARGVGASVGAFGGANEAATLGPSGALAHNIQGANARAGEISRGQGAFTDGGGAVRGQDLNTAAINAQLAQEQRALNEQHQQYAERLAWDTRNQAMQNAGRYRDVETGGYNADRARETARDAERRGAVVDAVNTAVGGATAGIGGGSRMSGSDPRSKMHVNSLSHLMMRRA